jgi:hypothetical protein
MDEGWGVGMALFCHERQVLNIPGRLGIRDNRPISTLHYVPAGHPARQMGLFGFRNKTNTHVYNAKAEE